MFKMSATGPNSLIFHTKYCNNIPMNHRETDKQNVMICTNHRLLVCLACWVSHIVIVCVYCIDGYPSSQMCNSVPLAAGSFHPIFHSKDCFDALATKGYKNVIPLVLKPFHSVSQLEIVTK